MYEPLLVARRLHASAALAIAGAAIIAAAALTPSRLRAVMMAVAVSFVAVDVYYFKFTHLLTRSDVVPQPARAVLRPAPMTFPQRRDLELRAALLTSGRLRATLSFNHVLRAVAAGPDRARHPVPGRTTPSSSPTRPDPRSGWTPGFALSIS